MGPRTIAGLIVLTIGLSLNGCGTTPVIKKVIGVSPKYQKTKFKNLAVFQFDLIDQVYKKEKWVSYRAPREKQMTELFETYLMKYGFNTIERERIDKIIKELGFSGSLLTVDQGLEIGKMLNVDVLVFGTISRLTFWAERKIIHIIVSIKAINVETGERLWKGDLDGTIDYSDSDTSGEMEVQDLTKNLFETLLKEI